jgi:hypothetical protein
MVIQMMGDIVSANLDSDYLVVGWFTTDDTYGPLAEAFAANLDQHQQPFHLFAVRRKPGAPWDTRKKPSVALAALDMYPGKTIILMDVDCRINGPLAPLANCPGDVGICLVARSPMDWRGRTRSPNNVIVRTSSRVVVLRPFAGAVTFVKEWERLCQVPFAHGARKVGGDEPAMIRAFLNCPWVSFYPITPAYSAQSTAPAGAIIEHDSAHDKQRARTVRGWLKLVEKRWLRSGRTKRSERLIAAPASET